MKFFPWRMLLNRLALFAALAIATAPAQASSCTPAPSGLVAWWQAESNALDSVGGTYGTLVNSAGFAPGEAGTAFNLNGVNQYLLVTSSNLDVGSSGSGLTFEEWINPTVLSGEQLMFEYEAPLGTFNGADTGVNFAIPAAPPGASCLYANLASTGLISHEIASPPGLLAAGVWQHIALTYDQASGVAAIYLNGASVLVTNIGSFTLRTSLANLVMGARTTFNSASNPGSAFPGELDEISLYNRALSANEIAAIFKAGSAGKCPSSVTGSGGVPAIASFSPAAGSNGTVVAIFGTNFSATAAANLVYFGAVKATVASASPTHLTVAVPAGATYAPITVTVNGMTAWARAPFMPTFAGKGSGISAAGFGPRQDLATLNGPGQTVIADLDGDGKPDLIVVDVYNNSISVFRNLSTNGTLTAISFAPRVDLPATPGAYSPGVVTVADVDGDGKLDIIMTEGGDNLVSIYQNNGTPGDLSSNSFFPRVDFATGTTPQGIAVRDLDGDGKPDIVTANSGDGTVSILRNLSGAGRLTTNSFAPKVDFAAGAGCQRVAVGDINGDGKTDVVAANASTISLLQNVMGSPGSITTNSFAARIDLAIPFDPVNSSGGVQVAIVDIDGDSRPDLAVTSYLPQTFSVFRNLTNGGNLTSNSFAPRIDFPLNGRGHTIAVGDLDGDGRPDLVVDTELNSLINVFRNVSVPGSFSASSLVSQVELATGWNAWGVSVGDLDGDGRPDIVFANSYDKTISIYQNAVPFGAAPAPSLLVNGGFENPAGIYPYQVFSTGASLPGWVVESGTVEITAGTYWQAPEGAQSLDLNGIFEEIGTIYQDFATLPGQYYKVRFAYAGNPECGAPILKTANVYWNSQLLTNLSFDITGHSVTNMGWIYYEQTIAATNLTSRIRFQATSTSFCGLTLDDVSVTPAAAPPTCTPPPAGLVSWWPGNASAVDIIGGNHGVLQGGAGFAAGEVGLAFNFNQTNEAVMVPASASLDVGAGSGFTLEAWINPADVTKANPIFEWNDLTYWGVHFNIEPGQPFNTNSGSGELYANIPDSSGNWHQMSSPGGVIVSNVFQHVALTYDQASGVAVIYCNGQTVASQNLGSFTPRTANRNLYLGERPAPPGEQMTFSGLIDEPAIYSRALTPAEIAAICQAGSAGKCYTPLPPFITAQPVNLTVALNNPAQFAVAAGGTPPLNYQWNFNGTNLPAATNATLAWNSVSLAQAGTYFVTVSNLAGGIASSSMVLTVYVPQIPPAITSQSPSQVVLLGSAATFGVAASGTDPLSYFWKRNNVIIPGATNVTYTLLNAQLSDSGSKFSCLVTNAYGFASSTNATLKVIDTIANDLCSGAILIPNASYTNVQSTLKASAFGDPVPDCVDGFGHGVWYQFTAPLAGLLVVDTFGSDFDTGLAVYTGACGSLTEAACNDDTGGVASQVTLPTTAGATYFILAGGYSSDAGNLVLHLNHFTPPAFDVQPTNLSVIVGSNGSFSATLSGTLPMSWQWYFNDAPLADGGRISGSTNGMLNIAGVLTNDGGSYYLVVSNFVGITTSSVAVLTPIILPPIITTPPLNRYVLAGSNVNFFAEVAGTPPYSYQWYFGGHPLVDDGLHITGSATASLTLSNLTTADAGSYSLLVSNLSGSANAAATLTVLVPPSITVPPVGRSVPPGLPTTFSAAASGVPAPVFQWQLNGTNIPGATGSSYAVTAVGASQLGLYHVIASNLAGSTTSANAQLTFGPVAAWGINTSGQLLPPPGLTNVIGVSGTYQASFAVRMDGSIAAWGGTSATNVPAGASNVVAIAASGNTAHYALRADGTVIGWNGIPAPATLSNLVQVAAGNSFGIALRAEGTLAGWGIQPYSVIPAGLNNVKAIACGYAHSLALRNDGTVIAWGTGAATNVPAGLVNVAAIAAGYTDSLALKTNGTVVAWGSGAGTNLPAGLTGITAIASEYLSSTSQGFHLALRSNGAVVAWGDNPNGETNPPAALSNLLSVAIAAAPYHGLALVNDGSPQILHPPVGLTAYTGRDVTLQAAAVGAAPLSYQWLRNGTNVPGATNAALFLPNLQLADAGSYQLYVSNSINTAISLPAPVNVISNNSLTFLAQAATGVTNFQGAKISVGGFTVLGSGPLRYQWFGSPSFNNYTPVSGATNDTLLLDPALAAQSGSYYLSVSNLVAGITSAPVNLKILFARAWGFQSVSNPPVNVTNAVAIATGGYQNYYGDYFGLGADGKLVSWANYFSSYGETNVSALSNTVVIAIAAGTQHTLALKSDGTVYAWGYGGYGQTNPPANLNGVTAIACGGYHDLALKADGTVVGWGATLQFNYGQATNNPAATNVVAIAAGAQHSLALHADGTVVAWGYSQDGTTTIPPTATNVVALAAGSGFSAALRANGTVVQWGNAMSAYPVPANLSNVVAISGSSTHCSALRNDGTVMTWGYEYTGLASNNLPPDLTNVIAITSGGDHDLALFGTRAPAFTVQPWNRTVVYNTSTKITLAGKCAGVQPTSYQWLLNGTNLPGATSDSLILTNQPFQTAPIRLIQPGAYQLVASNAYGVVTSKPAKVSVVIPLGDAMDAANLAWTTSGNAPWYGQTNYAHDGIDAARSGGIGGLQESILQTTLATNAAGTVMFWWKVSSEQYFDILEFRVNGTVQASLSGEMDWQQASIPVPAGTNLLQWRYFKDASFDAGLDAGFVDQFTFASAPVLLTQPANVVAKLGATVNLAVVATGSPTLGYQWRQNGTPVGNNNSVLTLGNVSRAQNGAYSVTVTNSGGLVISSNAVLKVLVPQVLSTPKWLPGGGLQLASTDANGGLLSPADLANFEAQASTNLTDWVTLTNALSLTNGGLQLQDNGSNYAARYYRIVEH